MYFSFYFIGVLCQIPLLLGDQYVRNRGDSCHIYQAFCNMKNERKIESQDIRSWRLGRCLGRWSLRPGIFFLVARRMTHDDMEVRMLFSSCTLVGWMSIGWTIAKLLAHGGEIIGGHCTHLLDRTTADRCSHSLGRMTPGSSSGKT